MERRLYYWLVCQDPDTKRLYLIAGGTTEEGARDKGLEMLPGMDFDIKALPTRNLARASSLLKGDKLERGHNLRKASEKLGHDKSLRRRLQRSRPQQQSQQGRSIYDW